MTKLTFKGALIAGAIVCAGWAGTALAQGPMMGGSGPGYGMGPGMMGGSGMGPGMMGGSGMGPGMMGGYGMGPGMMGGCGSGYGMGPGMMGADGSGGLSLSQDQRTELAKTQEELAKKRWDLMGKMREQGYRLQAYFAGGSEDTAAARAAFDAMLSARKELFDLTLEGRKQLDAILTREQREQLHDRWNASGGGPKGG